MEGSAAANDKPYDRGATGGLPPKDAAWLKAGLRLTGSFRRDAAAATKFWQQGAGFLAKLPKKAAALGCAAAGGRRNSSKLP